MKFLLTHPLRGATSILIETCFVSDISTHTPLAGCNPVHIPPPPNIFYFYSHTPCGVQRRAAYAAKKPKNFYSHTPCGVQLRLFHFETRLLQFLLTHPLRGATIVVFIIISVCKNFYSHTPCGVQQTQKIVNSFKMPFLLTHPLRGATLKHQ